MVKLWCNDSGRNPTRRVQDGSPAPLTPLYGRKRPQVIFSAGNVHGFGERFGHGRRWPGGGRCQSQQCHAGAATSDDRLPSEATRWAAPPPKPALRPGWSNQVGLPQRGHRIEVWRLTRLAPWQTFPWSHQQVRVGTHGPRVPGVNPNGNLLSDSAARALAGVAGRMNEITIRRIGSCWGGGWRG